MPCVIPEGLLRDFPAPGSGSWLGSCGWGRRPGCVCRTAAQHGDAVCLAPSPRQNGISRTRVTGTWCGVERALCVNARVLGCRAGVTGGRSFVRVRGSRSWVEAQPAPALALVLF